MSTTSLPTEMEASAPRTSLHSLSDVFLKVYAEPVQLPPFNVRARERQRSSPASLSKKTVTGACSLLLRGAYLAVPATLLRALYREAVQEAGGIARLPRLALGHSAYDPSLDPELVGTLRLVQSVVKPRKSLQPAGAISRFFLHTAT